jgi:hypothetical protein
MAATQAVTTTPLIITLLLCHGGSRRRTLFDDATPPLVQGRGHHRKFIIPGQVSVVGFAGW